MKPHKCPFCSRVLNEDGDCPMCKSQLDMHQEINEDLWATFRCPHCDEVVAHKGICPNCNYDPAVDRLSELEYGVYMIEEEIFFSISDANVLECPCPICQGNPTADLMYKIMFEHSDYDYRYDSCLAVEQDHYFDAQYNYSSPLRSVKSKPTPNRVIRIGKQYLALDIETAKTMPNGTDDWTSYRPLGISCAATLNSSDEVRFWFGKTVSGEIAQKMSREEVIALIDYLKAETLSGKTILTWNGLGLDFDILAEESALYDDCKKLALNHIDMMFHIFCLRGHPLSLDKAAKGMGLPGKPTNMNGELAPKYWSEGKKQQVLQYLAQDVRSTISLAQEVDKNYQLRWTSNRGNPQYVPLPSGWLTVKEAMVLLKPDVSWMANPWPRSKFMAWLSNGIPKKYQRTDKGAHSFETPKSNHSVWQKIKRRFF